MPESFVERYRITGKIGSGGMGEVVRATDSKLKREVAIKFLPDRFAHNEEKLARFHREVEILASLNHPNILIIHDVGVHQGSPFLVSELLKGRTLRDELLAAKTGDPIPPHRALECARQIAEGLAAAHAEGVIHRDLKPENIFVTESGQVKILDFGLAKLLSADNKPDTRDSGPSFDSESPTISATELNPTQPGRVVGTPSYMSPEQSCGAATDQLTDVFTFGTILYEMLSGKHPFKKPSSTETMTAILREDPPGILESNPDLSPVLDRILSRCLQKSKDRRFQTVSDLLFALENAEGMTESSLRKLEMAPTFLNQAMPWIAAVAIVIAAMSWILPRLGNPDSTFDNVRSTRKHPLFFPPPSDPWVDAALDSIVISPDGKKLVYVNEDGLWRYRLDRIQPPELLVESQGWMMAPFWAPGSDEVAYFSGNGLYRVSEGGGPFKLICDMENVSPFSGGSWFPDNQIVFLSGSGGLKRVSAHGGESEVMLALHEEERWFKRANPLPDGNGVLFVVYAPEQTGGDRIELWTRDGTRKTLLDRPDGVFDWPVYSPTGHIVYQNADKEVWAFGFSLSSYDRTTEPFRIGQGRNPSVSNDGTLLMNASPDGEYQLVWVSRDGTIIGTIGRSLPNLAWLRLSPDGQRAAVAASGNNADIWIYEILRENAYLLSGGPDLDIDPFWFPDSQRILYRKWSKGIERVVERSIDSASEEVERMKGFFAGLSADGKYLFLTRPRKYVDLEDPEQERVPFPESFQDVSRAVPSPDSSLLALVSNETGENEIYLVRFPSFTGKTKITVDGAGLHPVWSPDGSELYYAGKEGRSIWSVRVTPGVGAEGKPSRLFELPMTVDEDFFDVAEDGRFLMRQLVRENEKPKAVIIENWIREFEGN